MKPNTVKVTILILIFCSLSVWGSQEVPIITEPHNQYDPAVYDDIVVWEDDRNGNYDIYGYNLVTHEEFQITTHPDDQENPAIYENMVVWEDHRNDTWAIYGYNLSTRQEIPIPISGSDPAIYENTVICITMGGGNPAICGYNLLTEEVIHIGLDPGNVYLYPEIHSNIIVWKSTGKDGQIINVYNMETHKIFKVPERRLFFPIHDQDYPAVYTDTIIWTEDFYNIIYAYNLATGAEQVVAVTRMGDCEPSSRVRSEVIGSRKPALYQDTIVWVDCRNGNYDIYGFNCSTGEEFSITTSQGNQQSPAIYENIVVWEDNRNGNYDIYGCYLVPPLEITTASRTGTVLLHSLVTVLIVVLIGVNLLVVGLNCVYLKKGTPQKPATEDHKPHYRLFFVIGWFYALLGVVHLCIARPYFGVLWLTVSAIWFIGIVRSLNKPPNPGV